MLLWTNQTASPLLTFIMQNLTQNSSLILNVASLQMLILSIMWLHKSTNNKMIQLDEAFVELIIKPMTDQYQ